MPTEIIKGSGEMAQLTRQYDWSTTALKGIASWPPALVTSVNMMLHSRFPMLIFWGPELITLYNDAFRPSLGGNGKHPGSLGQPGHISWAESWPVIGPMINNIMQGGDAVWFEDQKLPLYREGKMGYAYWTYSFSPLFNDQGAIGGLLVTCSETTKAVESVQQLAESEKRFRTMSEASDILIAVNDHTSQADYFNQAWINFTGRSLDELLSYSWLDLVHPEDKDRVLADYLEAFNKQQSWSWEFRMLNSAGVYKWLLATGAARYYDDGSFAGYVSSCIDITSRKEHEIDRHQYTEKLQQAIDTAKMGTWSIDLATVKVTMSDFVKDLLGLPLDRDPEMDQIMAAVHPDYHTMLFNALDNAIKNHASSDTEYPVTNLVTGQTKWVKATGKVFADHTGNPSQYSGLFMDITERKLDELRKNDFISMVSHELRTPLTTVSAAFQLLQGQLPAGQGEYIDKALEIGISQSKKMQGLIAGFLTISQLESGKIQLAVAGFDINILIRETIAEALMTSQSREIVFEETSAQTVQADRVKIGAVLANLLSNALKYSGADTVVVVTVEPSGSLIQVNIADRGMGIPVRDRERIFERFYRGERNTHQMISGFGIGLYVSAEIVHRHGGRIWVDSASGEGSVFHFTLPSAESQP